jgi:hypothetical protein
VLERNGSRLISLHHFPALAAAYVKEGFTNMRVGMFLEVATTLGALLGAFLAGRVPTSAIAIIFGLVLLHSAYLSIRPLPERLDHDQPDPLATRLRMHGTYPGPQGLQAYDVHAVPSGFGLMALAGALSGLLGIGSGAVKVLAMDQVMRIPFKVSTTTSNFMIGVTAAASAGVYLAESGHHTTRTPPAGGHSDRASGMLRLCLRTAARSPLCHHHPDRSGGALVQPRWRAAVKVTRSTQVRKSGQDKEGVVVSINSWGTGQSKTGEKPLPPTCSATASWSDRGQDLPRGINPPILKYNGLSISHRVTLAHDPERVVFHTRS